MSKKNRRRRENAAPTPFEQARDEVFQHIMQCGVIGALPEHQQEWFSETLTFISSRYPELEEQELKQLRTLGERFVQPPKASEPEEEQAAPEEELATNAA